MFFWNQSIINFLILYNDKNVVDISIIVYLETLFWYLTKGLSAQDFNKDIQDSFEA